VAGLLVNVSNAHPDFAPSQFFISIHLEMMKAYEYERDVDWTSISQEDPHILESDWLHWFAMLRATIRNHGVSTPGK
jgi:hypothetical protein